MPRSGVAGSYGSSIFNFFEKLIFMMVAPVYISTNNVEEFLFPHIPAIIVLWFLPSF